jgi:hypothetical protein
MADCIGFLLDARYDMAGCSAAISFKFEVVDIKVKHNNYILGLTYQNHKDQIRNDKLSNSPVLSQLGGRVFLFFFKWSRCLKQLEISQTCFSWFK